LDIVRNVDVGDFIDDDNENEGINEDEGEGDQGNENGESGNGGGEDSGTVDNECEGDGDNDNDNNEGSSNEEVVRPTVYDAEQFEEEWVAILQSMGKDWDTLKSQEADAGGSHITQGENFNDRLEMVDQMVAFVDKWLDALGSEASFPDTEITRVFPQVIYHWGYIIPAQGETSEVSIAGETLRTAISGYYNKSPSTNGYQVILDAYSTYRAAIEPYLDQ
jgi:hypothetical protein